MEIKARTAVIIPNWNGISYLPNCLESLKRQSTQDFEIILVDNGSRDSSLSFVEKNYPDVHIDALSRNVGFGCAVNSGIKEIHKDAPAVEYIILLNNDTIADKHFVENLVARMDTNKDFFYGAAKIMLFEPKGMINSCGYGYSTFGLDYHIGYGEIDRGQYDEEREVFGAYSAAAIYRKDFFKKVGRFDETFFAYSDDMDLNFRAQLTGYRCLYIPSAQVRHHNMGSVGYLGYSLYCFHKTKNSLLLILKHLPASVILSNFHKIAYIQLKTLIAALKESVFLGIIRSYIFVFLLAPEKLISKFKISMRRRIHIGTLVDRMVDYHPYPRKHHINLLTINFLIDTDTPKYIEDSIVSYAKLLKIRGHYSAITYVYNVDGSAKIFFRLKNIFRKMKASFTAIWGSVGLVRFGRMKGLRIRYIPNISDRYILNGEITISSSAKAAEAAANLSKEKGVLLNYIVTTDDIDKAIKGNIPALNITYSPAANTLLSSEGVKIDGILPLFLDVPPVEIKSKKRNEIATILLPYYPDMEESFEGGLKSLEILRKKGINFNLIIIGSKPPADIPSYAKFTGTDNKKRLGQIYWTGDILLSPSSSGGHSLTIMEGMAFGCAVVSNKAKGEHFLVDGKTALLAKDRDYLDMAEKVQTLIENKDLLKVIGAKGVKSVKRFSGNKSGEIFEAALKDISSTK